MHQSVYDNFIKFTVPLEGLVDFMYCDTVRLVTVGIGIMMPNADAATQYKFRWRDTNKLATAAEIRSEWNRIWRIGQTGSANKSYTYFKKYAQLYLPDSESYRVALQKLLQFEDIFVEYFPEFKNWPADAQMAAMQMAWNMGPRFSPGWPKLTKSLRDQDFDAAADNCMINGRPSDRNTLDRKLFQNAAKVLRLGASKSKLWYPEEPKAPAKPKPILVIDGNLGSQTIKALQKELGVFQDGDLGPVTIKALQRYLNKKIGDDLKGDTLEIDGIGLYTDGETESRTTKVLQKYLGVSVDGIIAPKDSETVRALQKALATNKF
jgi:GH24 family phage-related lysozyme (muramidase)